MKKINQKEVIMNLRENSDQALPKESFKKDLEEKLIKNFDSKQSYLQKYIFSRKLFLSTCIVLVLAIFLVTNFALLKNPTYINKFIKVNNWEYSDKQDNQDLFNSIRFSTKNQNMTSLQADSSSELGFTTGGSKDINNFRDNIKNGYLPIPTDITPEGLFYNYYFDTGKQEDCKKLFCPSYSFALTKDPFSNQNEYYMTVGLNSGIKASDFKRKPLNLMVVLDISGSMSSPFNQYYYDSYGNKVMPNEEYSSKTKLEIAKQTIIDMTKHLNDGDNFGMVLFDDKAYIGKKMSSVGETDMDAVRSEIAKLQPRGGTNMEAGITKGKDLIDEFERGSLRDDDSENRIIFLTDAMPNMGNYSSKTLAEYAKDYSDQKVYSTFIGIGVDFNTDLIEQITKVKGANYFSVHTESEFKKTLDEDFDFMVTPLVFDLQLNFESQGFIIEKVYGSPEANQSTGQLMKVNTLFPSRSKDGEVKGGIVLLKLKRISDRSDYRLIKLTASYEDKFGKKETDVKKDYFRTMDPDVLFKVAPSQYFDNNGIRKAVLLSQYNDLITDWLIDANSEKKLCDPYPCLYDYEEGIKAPDFSKSKWERTSKRLEVSQPYKEAFAKFKIYFDKEIKAIGDDSLSQEDEILDLLIK